MKKLLLLIALGVVSALGYFVVVEITTPKVTDRQELDIELVSDTREDFQPNIMNVSVESNGVLIVVSWQEPKFTGYRPQTLQKKEDKMRSIIETLLNGGYLDSVLENPQRYIFGRYDRKNETDYKILKLSVSKI